MVDGQPQKASNSNDLINLNRIPHPEEDASLRSYGWEKDDDWISVGKRGTAERQPLPFPTYQYTFVDTGISSPRYMRCTMRVLPQSYYMLNKTKLPCSVFVTPFADPVSPFPLPHPSTPRRRRSRCSTAPPAWCAARSARAI